MQEPQDLYAPRVPYPLWEGCRVWFRLVSVVRCCTHITTTPGTIARGARRTRQLFVSQAQAPDITVPNTNYIALGGLLGRRTAGRNWSRSLSTTCGEEESAEPLSRVQPQPQRGPTGWTVAPGQLRFSAVPLRPSRLRGVQPMWGTAVGGGA